MKLFNAKYAKIDEREKTKIAKIENIIFTIIGRP